MALHLVVYGIISALLIHFSLVHSRNGQVSPSNSSVQQMNYVTPNRSMPCLTDRHPCLTIDEYASQIDKFFLNDSIFSFDPGNHSLNVELNISGIHNVSFIGLSNNSVKIMVVYWSARISWEDCKNLEISDINFIIEINFSYVLSFKSTLFVKVSNITILGNGHIGCSSIVSERSVVEISDSTFTGITGFYGAALTASTSNIKITGSNYFMKNEAISGGAMFFYDSDVLFKGTNSFIENSASFLGIGIDLGNECFSTDYSMVLNQLNGSPGGAISSYSSTIIIMDYFSDTSTTSEFSRCYQMNDNHCSYKDIDSQVMKMCRIMPKNSDFYSIGETNLPCLYSKLSTKNRIPSLKFYYNFAVDNGGSIFSTNTSIKAVGTIEFAGNYAGYDGGALYLRKTYFCFIGTPCLTRYVSLDNSLQLSSHMLFFNNSAGQRGGALCITDTNSYFSFYGSISFVNNSANLGGALYIQNSRISLNGDGYFSKNFTSPGVYIMFTNNFGRYAGGAVCLEFSTLQMSGSVSLTKNNAATNGGAIALFESTIQMFENILLVSNNAIIGGAIVLTRSTMQMCGNISLVENSATAKGGALYLNEATVQICGSVAFVNNNANIGGAIHTEASIISIGVNCSNIHVWSTIIVFRQNTATYSGGSISSIDSRLYFMGSALFDGNNAGYGGAIILDGTSNLIQQPNLTLSFMNNTANEKGGVFYYDHSVSSCDRFKQYYKHIPECFVSFEGITPELKNNFASKTGSFLYSGNLGSCYHSSGKISILQGCNNNLKHRHNFCSNLHLLFKNSNNTKETNQLFSADAEDVKFCSFQRHSNTQMIVSVFPGEKFSVSLTSMGTFNLPVSTKILHKILLPTDENIELRRMQRLTKVNNSCTNISYYLLVSENAYQTTAHFKLYHQNSCDSLVDGVNLFIDIKPCPLGFQLSRQRYKCTCDIWLQDFGVTDCNIDNLSVEREKNTFWLSKQDNNSGLIFHNNRCPFDFCKDEKLNVTLDNAGAQCDFNRNGTLCGQCREQYSLALGTLHCLYCANSSYIALIIPFALAGIALVMVILLLHLTVDVGTLNGLIFYTNIVHSNREVYFQHTREITNFYAIFISWLNLDFGIETCFYDGMGIYAYSWLQFLFPFYLWFLIGAIIFICRYSQRISKSLGRNPVAALGTLLFLSYGKVLNAIIAPLSKTELVLKSNHGSNSTCSVWLYDGSVEYFAEPEHIALGLFAILILLFAFVPYTFILLFGHWLIGYSDKYFLSWLNKIKPFLDVYYAPFKQEARYWIGLTLLARSALLLTIAINAVGSDSVNLLVITSVMGGLLSIKGRVYEHRYKDVLESSFILNLLVFSVATFYLKDKNFESQPAILSASVGISFVIFIGILFFHIHLLFKSKNIWKYVIKNSLFHKNWLLCKTFKIVTKEDENVALKSNDPKVVTSTLVELREPLIDNDEV